MLLVGVSLFLLAQLDPTSTPLSGGARSAQPAELVALVALAAPAQQATCPEPNDGFAQACPIVPPVQVSGYIDPASDLDVYMVRVGAPSRLTASLTGLTLDYDLRVYTAAAQLVAESASEGTVDEKIDVQIDLPGNYFIFVNSGRGDSSATSPYLLSVNLVAANSQPAASPTDTPVPTAVGAPPSQSSGAGGGPAPSGPAALLQTVDNARVVLRRPDGTTQDGVPSGTALEVGDSVGTVGSGSATLQLLGGSTLRLNRDSAVNLVRLDLAADGTQTIQVEQTRGRSNHQVSLPNGGSSYTVFANKIPLVAHGTSFDSELRDTGLVLFDCLDCDRNRVSAYNQPLGSGQRLAVAPSGEVFVLKIYEEPPNPEEERQKEEEDRRREEEKANSKP
jgi:hypothetical protein